jgi:hypothetical protein
LSGPPADEPTLGLIRLDKPRRYIAWYPPAEPVTYQSVTTILDVIAKPALLNWYGSIAAAWAVDNVEVMLRMLADLGRDVTVKAVAARGRAERDRKGAIGTRAHQAIEAMLAGLPVLTDPDTAPLVEQYRRFARDWRFVPEWSEAMVVSERYGYAGTLDLIGYLAGRRAMIDLKTGSYMAPEMGIQLAAYGGADYIGRPGTTDRWAIPSIELNAVLQLLPTEYRLIPYAVGAAELEAFNNAAALAAWQREYGRRIMGQPLTEGMLKIA